MLLDYGLSNALAYKHNFQQDIANDQRNEMLDRQARIDAENKTKLFADEFKFGEATTDYNKQQLKAYTEKLIPEIGKFVNENPDYRTNTMKYAKYRQMTGSLLKNKWVDNDMQFQGMKKEFAKYIADPKNDSTRPEITGKNGILDQIKNVNDTGSSDGVKGNDLPFTFMAPKPYADLDKESAFIGKNFESFDYKPELALGKNARIQVPQERPLQQRIDSFYGDNKSQIDHQSKQAGFKNGRDYAESLIRNQVPQKVIQIPEDQERMLALREKYKEAKPTEDVWTNNYAKKANGSTNADILQKTFGPKASKAYLMADDIRNAPEDLSGYNIKRTGEWVTFPDTMPQPELRGKKANIGYIDMPLEWGIGKGFYENNEIPEDLGRTGITHEKLGKATIAEDDKGKNKLRLTVYETPDLNNTQYKVLMNSAVLPTKLEGGQEAGDEVPSTPIVSSEEQYNKLKTGEQYQDSQGIIRVKK